MESEYFVIFRTKDGGAIPLLNKNGVLMQLFSSELLAEKAAQKLYCSKLYSDRLDSFEVSKMGEGVLQVT